MYNKALKIHVAMASDDKYAHHLAVALCSILKTLSLNATLCVYILYEKLEEKTKEKIENLKDLRDFELNFINISCEKYEPFKIIVGLYISRLTYARFQLPSILHHLDKCIYLDCDVLVKKDLKELWDIELPEHAVLGAIEEPSARCRRNQELKIPESASYFNAGVLVFDLEKMRKMNLEKMAFAYLQKSGSLLYADQDVLNALFYDLWFALPLKWNVHSNVFILKHENKYFKYQDKEVEMVFEEVAIVHFSHEIKPDSLISTSPYRDEYWKYIKYTEWRNSLPSDINLRNLILRTYWGIKELARKVPMLFYVLRTAKRLCTGYYLTRVQTIL